MDYDDHLEKHKARLRDFELQSLEADRRKVIALEEAFREAETIIKAVIQPELEVLRAALLRHDFPAKITVTREVSDLSPDSVFETGIELREDIHPSNVRRGVIFTAVPNAKCFSVSVMASRAHGAGAIRSEMKFCETTGEAVQRVCSRFMEAAFSI